MWNGLDVCLGDSGFFLQWYNRFEFLQPATGNTIQDSTYSGIFIEEPALNISVTYASNNIINAGTYGVYIQGSATGTSLFNSNTVNGAPSGKFLNTSTGFTVSGAGITGVGGKRKRPPR
ncbi:right-handed parallel beta-helix repeat-containing protein [Paenibacillus sp. FSL R10-2199]|uniref:right-handed parallel beta-helix repeat-containing protein n=1 Tax=Paenibacillus sp. FSL R10-2199 TaxID=2975348 RepID=UPI0030F73C34